MTTRAASVLQDALRLSEQERSEVLDALAESLQSDFAPGIEEQWRREVVGRVASLEIDSTSGVSWDALRNRLRLRLGGAAEG